MRLLPGLMIALMMLGACSKKDDTANQQKAEAVTAMPMTASQQTAATQPATTSEQAPVQQDQSVPQDKITKAASPLPAQVSTNPYESVMPSIVGQILTKTIFNCQDKSSFAAQFESAPNQVRITFAKQPTLVLPMVNVTNGFSYKTAQFELRGAGNLATWTVVGKPGVKCRANRI